MAKFTTLMSRIIPLLANDIDTDQIIPARFLKLTDKIGWGERLFADWRYNTDGTKKSDFVLNNPEYENAQILLAGDNFGCGSSREHAPWALTGFGIKTIISTSFADIFKSNALKNGLLPIVLSRQEHQEVADVLKTQPQTEITISLADCTATLSNGKKYAFSIDRFSRTCLLEGIDELGYLMKFENSIKAYEAQHENG
jgi:3-isopropylmalate/(R)-2-methylmalate dehydratase small subunit